jgi:hypothetical protein
MYCTNCGSELTGNENFCSNCGKSRSSNREELKDRHIEKIEFSSSFLLGGNLLTPDKIIITNSEVIYRKRNKYLIGVDELSIPFNRISSVEINRKLIDADIIIYSTGNQKIIAEDFSISSSKKIKKEIETRINN